jgi:hypothetical protein
MQAKVDPPTGRASVKAGSNASLGIIGGNRIRLSPRTGHERPMIAENVGQGVVLIVPDVPPTKRFLYFLWALVGEILSPRRRASDHRR